MKLLRLFIPPILFSVYRFLTGRNKRTTHLVPPNNKIINSFSQFYEDLIIDSILKSKTGFYIDIGAYDPVRLSNTYRFYLTGWRGINVEPQTNRYLNFAEQRPNDINVNAGVAANSGLLKLYCLENEDLSTFDYEVAIKSSKKFKCRIKDIKEIPVCSLSELLNRYLPQDQTIDFLSIDTEGFDLAVLQSNDWSKYQPRLILIEFGMHEQEIYDYLTQFGYHLVYRNNVNVIYLLNV